MATLLAPASTVIQLGVICSSAKAGPASMSSENPAASALRK
jgi:hypothetical protein